MAVRAGRGDGLAPPRARLCGGAADHGPAALAEPGGTLRHSQLSAGGSYFRPAGVEYDVINDNEFEFVFVEIEMMKGS